MCLLSLTGLFLLCSPLMSAGPEPMPGLLSGLALLFVPLIVATFCWWTTPWGWAAVFWGSGLAAWAGLAASQPLLFALPPLYAAAGGLTGWGIGRWDQTVRTVRIEADRLEEQINTLQDGLAHLQRGAGSLQLRGARYRKLVEIANAFNSTLAQDQLSRKIVEAAGQIVEEGDIVLLYGVVRKTLSLELQAVWRRLGHAVIRAKQGDEFDQWVMRQAQPLLVEETDRDFRFPKELREGLGRPVGSVLAVPLATAHRLIGVLRVESVRPRGLGPDALRLARIVGDLASLALENSRLYRRMEDLAITDDLTGLTVRVYFEKRLAEELARAAASEAPISLLLIDIDHFKSYNDRFGHSAGDLLLKHIARLLTDSRKPGEVAGRFGGEELAFLLPGVGRKEALRRAEAIRKATEQSVFQLRREVSRVTVSIGVATTPDDGGEAITLLKAADRLLYQAKSAGRNRVCASS